MSRLNDLQRSFAHATLFFPGDAQERACFAGDSWFIVREVRPDEDEASLWKMFCGRVFALLSIAAEIEHDLGTPGLRAIASRGRLVQIIDPDGWREDFKPVPSVGPGAYEIRVRDEAGAFRVIYVANFQHAVYVLHAFQKKERKTSQADIDLAARRYKVIGEER